MADVEEQRRGDAVVGGVGLDELGDRRVEHLRRGDRGDGDQLEGGRSGLEGVGDGVEGLVLTAWGIAGSRTCAVAIASTVISLRSIAAALKALVMRSTVSRRTA